MKYIILIFVILATSPLQANPKIYKWTDAQGNTHYSEKKPNNQKTSEVKIRNTSSNIVAYEPTPTPTKENDEQALTKEQEVEEYNNNMQKQTNKKNCAIAKKNLAALQQTSHILRKDPKTGKDIYLDDKARIDLMKASKKTIREACK